MSTSPLTALCWRAERLVSKQGFAKKVKTRKGVKKKELNIQTPKPNGQSNGHLLVTEKSRSIKTDDSHASLLLAAGTDSCFTADHYESLIHGKFDYQLGSDISLARYKSVLICWLRRFIYLDFGYH